MIASSSYDSSLFRLLESSRQSSFRNQFVLFLGQRTTTSSLSSDGLECLYRLVNILNENRPRPTINWIYDKFKKSDNVRIDKKKAHKIAKHNIKKQVSNFNIEKNDLFQQFMSSNEVNQLFYKDSDILLGTSCDICIFQNFTSLTPNYLAKIIETVSGGGSIIYLIENCSNFDDLVNLEMKYHAQIQSELCKGFNNNLNKRFVYTLLNSKHCVFLNSNLEPLNSDFEMSNLDYKIHHHDDTDVISKIISKHIEDNVLCKLLKLCKSQDQAQSLVKLDMFLKPEFDYNSFTKCVYLHSPRGRGKSALLGISLALLLVKKGFSNVAITAPTPEQLKTTFDFLLSSFDNLGYTENVQFAVQRTNSSSSSKPIESIMLKIYQRQIVKFIPSSEFEKFQYYDLVIVDEAAAIPLVYTKKIIQGKLSLLSSTNVGYEGTGRSLTYKLIDHLRKNSNDNLLEIVLETPIRYSLGDPVEFWLNKYLCLNPGSINNDESSNRNTKQYPDVDNCQLYRINKNILFSNNKYSEYFLDNIINVLTNAHYKNSPNDLISIADSKSHEVFCLVPKNFDEFNQILTVLLVNYEGMIDNETFSHSHHTPGNLIPYTISQAFFEPSFQKMIGLRIVRIATNDQFQKLGYGTKCLHEFEKYINQGLLLTDENLDNALFTPITDCKPQFSIDYIGTSFGLNRELYKFWEKHSFIPIHLSHSENATTGEYSCIMLKAMDKNQDNISWIDQFYSEFTLVFLRKCQSLFCAFDSKIAASFVKLRFLKIFQGIIDLESSYLINSHIFPYDLKRLKKFSEQSATVSNIIDILPNLSILYFIGCLDVYLSPLQSCILMGLGLQSKNIEKLSLELDLPVKNINGILNQSIHIIATYLLDNFLQSKISIVKNQMNKLN